MAESVCPSCGYCEKCGRKNNEWIGYQPYYVWPNTQPVYPMTVGPYWYTTSSGITGGGAGSYTLSASGVC
jgi:hypothetical protein